MELMRMPFEEMGSVKVVHADNPPAKHEGKDRVYKITIK